MDMPLTQQSSELLNELYVICKAHAIMDCSSLAALHSRQWDRTETGRENAPCAGAEAGSVCASVRGGATLHAVRQHT